MFDSGHGLAFVQVNKAADGTGQIADNPKSVR